MVSDHFMPLLENQVACLKGDSRADIANGLHMAHFHLYNNILEVTYEECIETARSQSVFLPRLTGDRALCKIGER